MVNEFLGFIDYLLRFYKKNNNEKNSWFRLNRINNNMNKKGN